MVNNEVIFVKGRGLARPSVSVNGMVPSGTILLSSVLSPPKGNVQTYPPPSFLSDRQKGKCDKTNVIVPPGVLMGPEFSPKRDGTRLEVQGQQFPVKTHPPHLSCREVCW